MDGENYALEIWGERKKMEKANKTLIHRLTQSAQTQHIECQERLFMS